MEKTYKEIKPGDVFRTEYGDYNNFVDIVFESNEIEDNWLKTIGHYYKSETKFEGYAPIHYGNVPKYDVIKEVE